MIGVASPIISTEEIKAVNDVLASGMLAQGARVSELEESFAAYCGTKYAAAVNSGTAALHAALFAAGIGPGDEVITTPFSFIATINPILMLGATPVLADIDALTFNISPESIKKVVTSKTKALLPVHLYGQSYDHDEISAIAKEHNLRLIEDACQAVGADYKDRKTGGLGDAGCFSLYATKNIMCGEGGIVTTNDEAFIAAIRRFRQHGMTAPYEYAELGYNYRMTDLQAAIAIEQLKKVNDFSDARANNAQLLNEALKDISGIVLPIVGNDRTHVYHQYTIRVTKDFAVSRGILIEKLKARDIGSGIYYPKPLHAYPHIAKLGYRMGDFPVSEQAATEVLSLPVHPKVTSADIAKIGSAFREISDGA